MKYLPRSNEALAEAAYHVVFSPCANLKGRQQLQGKHEWHKKIVYYHCPLGLSRCLLELSAAALAGSSCRWGWMENKFPDLQRSFSGLRGFCPQKPIIWIHLSVTIHCSVSCRSRTQYISRFFWVLDTPRVLLYPTIRLGSQETSDICQMPEPSSEFSVNVRTVWLLMKIPKQPFGNQAARAYSHRRISKCLTKCLVCITFPKPNIRAQGWKRTSESGPVLTSPGCRVALTKKQNKTKLPPCRCTNLR